MKSIIATLSAFIFTINAQSRYFINEFVSPVKTQYQGYPIDVCIIYEVGLDGLTPVDKWGQYTCTAEGNVQFREYGTDDTCTTQVGAAVTYTTSAAEGEVGAFNCVGVNDYVVTDGCQVSAGATGECCSADDCRPVIQPQNVCVNNKDGTWSKVSCDATGSSTYTYTSAECLENDKSSAPLTESAIDECNYYVTNVIFDIYLRMSRCYVNGNGISTDTFCGYTYEPSQSPIPPTPPTTNPTQMPSMAPTEYNGIEGYAVMYGIVVIVTFVSVFMF